MNKKIIIFCAILCAAVVLLCVGAIFMQEDGSSPASYDTGFSASLSECPDNATVILFNGESADIDGRGASLSDNTVTLSQRGSYRIRGSFSGMLKVAAGSRDEVDIWLDGTDIVNDSGPAIYIESADKVNISLCENTENIITDGENYLPSFESLNVKAALFSKEDIRLSGEGSLTVNGNYCHGICSKDELEISDGVYTVNAVSQGIHGKDYVKIQKAVIDITSGSDGIQSDNTQKGRGFVYVLSGDIKINAGDDGIQAQNYLDISGGDLNVNATGKGIKCADKLTLSGGTVSVNSSDDAVHSNGDIDITDGILTLTASDDGIHADNELNISGGDITVAQSYEGAEGKCVYISGGKVNITASDDGINAAGGSDGSDNLRPGDIFMADGDAEITVSGGNIVINAQGDGMDSNGALTVTGGDITVFGPENSANGALDCNGSAKITGGRVLALGASGMAISFNDGEQCSALCVFDETLKQGDRLTLTDASGNVLFDVSAAKSFNSAVFSCPELKKNESYTVSANDVVLKEFTLADTHYSEMGGGFGGGFDRGGMTPGGDRQGRMPEMPEGEVPEMPDGNMTPGQRPDMQGEAPGQRPEMPEGEMPQMPDGNTMPGQRPDMQDKTL